MSESQSQAFGLVHPEHSTPLIIDLVAGICGGSAGVLAGHPLDTIKVRLQTQLIGQNLGIGGVFRSIVKKEGVVGLYKGMASPLVGVAVINSLLFAVYGSALRIFSKDAKDPTVGDIFIAGSISGFVNGFFSTPIELVKIRLQNQTNSPRHYGGEMYKGPTDCVRQILKQNGLKGLFKGLPTTLLRETPSYGAYFASYEIFCRMFSNADPNQPSSGILLAGGFAGIVGWLSTYPIDVVKTRLQSISEDRNPKYKTLINGFRTIMREEGFKAFSSGLGATALRAFPTNAVTFFVVMSCRDFLESVTDTK